LPAGTAVSARKIFRRSVPAGHQPGRWIFRKSGNLPGHEPCFSEGRTGFPAEILPDPGFRRSFMFRPGTGPFHGRVRFFHPGFRSRRKRAAAGGPHAAHQFFIGFPSFTFLLTKTGILFNN